MSSKKPPKYIAARLERYAVVLLDAAKTDLDEQNQQLVKTVVEHVWAHVEDQTEKIKSMSAQPHTLTGQWWLLEKGLQNPEIYYDIVAEVIDYAGTNNIAVLAEHATEALAKNQKMLQTNMITNPLLLERLLSEKGAFNSEKTQNFLKKAATLTIPGQKGLPVNLLKNITYNPTLKNHPHFATDISIVLEQTNPQISYMYLAQAVKNPKFFNYPQPQVLTPLIKIQLETTKNTKPHLDTQTDFLSGLIQNEKLPQQLEPLTLNHIAQFLENPGVLEGDKNEILGSVIAGNPTTWETLFYRLTLWEKYNTDNIKLPKTFMQNFTKNLPAPTVGQKVAYDKLAQDYSWINSTTLLERWQDTKPVTKLNKTKPAKQIKIQL